MSDEFQSKHRRSDWDRQADGEAGFDGTVELSADDIEPVAPMANDEQVADNQRLAESSRPAEPADSEATQLLDQDQIEAVSEADSTPADSTPAESTPGEPSRPTPVYPTPVDPESPTSSFDVPEALLDELASSPSIDAPGRSEADDNATTRKFDVYGGPKIGDIQPDVTRPMSEVDDTQFDDPADQDVTLNQNITFETSDFDEPARTDADGFIRFVARPRDDGSIALPDHLFGKSGPGRATKLVVKIKVVESSD